MLSSFIAGMLAERLNRKWLYFVSLCLVSLCTFGYAFSNTFTQIFGLTMFYGFF